MREFAAFSPDNDPYGEHDFGAIEWDSIRVFFKLDYYDRDMRFGSPDPADPAVTTRVLTIFWLRNGSMAGAAQSPGGGLAGGSP